MIKWKDRPRFVDSLYKLLGNTGVLYITPDSILQLRTLPEKAFHKIPKISRRVGFDLADINRFFLPDRWELMDLGKEVNILSKVLDDGIEYPLQAIYLIFQRRIF